MAEPGGDTAKRLVRVLRMLRTIERQPGRWTRKVLAEEFGVSERMIDRDLHLLRSAGYEVLRHRTGYEVVPFTGPQ